jgi:hypothetical protein
LSRGQKKISSHPKTFPKIAENRQTGSFSPAHLPSLQCKSPDIYKNAEKSPQACNAKALTYNKTADKTQQNFESNTKNE